MNKPECEQVPKIGETEEDKLLSTPDLKTKYRLFMQQSFQGRKFLNKYSNVWITVSHDSVRQWVVKSRTRQRIILVQILDFLLENSLYDDTPVPDRKKRPEIKQYRHFHHHVIIDKKKYNVTLKVVEYVDKSHKFYYYSLANMGIN